MIFLSGLQSLTFGGSFNQSMDNVTLPSGLQSLTFGRAFIESMDNVAMPSGLQILTLRAWPSGLPDAFKLHWYVAEIPEYLVL